MEAMAKTPSKLKDKISFLIQKDAVKLVDVAMAVGVSYTQISNYMEGAVPNGASLVALADYFDTSVEWLLDDTAPANKPAGRLQYINNDDLMNEAAARYTKRFLKIVELLDRAEKIDWDSFSQQIQEFSIPAQPVYTLPLQAQMRAQLDVLFFLRGTLLQDVLDPCDSVNLAFRISKFGGGKLPVEVDASDNPARMYIYQRIDDIYRRALTTEYAQSIFRWAMTRAIWSGPDAIFGELEKALDACGV